MAFRHYVITCLNVGVYSHRQVRSNDRLAGDAWMDHRVRLFETFTLPGIRGQRCRNFTWLLFLDIRTPPRYKLWVESLRVPNLVPVYLTCRGLDGERIARAVVDHTEPGDYDLITTELDSDDAIHESTIGLIQQRYRPRGHTWAISFAQGVILDLAGRRAWLMDYPYHLPTLIEPRGEAGSVYRYPNDQLPAAEWELIPGAPYWLQVVHGQNVANQLKDGPSRVIRRDCPVSPSVLRAFHVNWEALGALERRPSRSDESCYDDGGSQSLRDSSICRPNSASFGSGQSSR